MLGYTTVAFLVTAALQVPLLRAEQRELILADGSGTKVVQKAGWLAKTDPQKYDVALHQAYRGFL